MLAYVYRSPAKSDLCGTLEEVHNQAKLTVLLPVESGELSSHAADGYIEIVHEELTFHRWRNATTDALIEVPHYWLFQEENNE